MAKIELKRPEFIRVEGGYGFDQNSLAPSWPSFYVDRACGLAGLANLIGYELGRQAQEVQENEDLLEKLIGILRPKLWGIPSIRSLNKALKGLKKTLQGTYFIQVYRGKTHGYEAYDYIKKNLEEDRPILVLNTNHPIRAFKNHWITVTGLEEEEGETYVYFSSWGKKYKLAFDQLFNKDSLFRSMGVLKKK